MNILSTKPNLKYSLIIVLVLLFFSSLYGQRVEIDTSDYLPYYFDEAIDYNLIIAASKGYNTEIDRLIKKGARVDVETIEGATPLIYAVANNHTDAVRSLLAYGPDVNKSTQNYQTPLIIAAKNQNVDIAEALIRAGADINKTDQYGATPLHYVSYLWRILI